jgi:hypothetical protein
MKNLSGVFITKVYPGNIPKADYWLFEHPFSENKMNFKDLGLRYDFVKNAQIEIEEGKELDDIFNIPKNWIDE